MNDIKEAKPILLVEDETVMRESVRDWLTDIGYRVKTAGDGEQAMRNISDEEFGLVILDLRLPGKDGLEVLREARARQPQLKGIVITAYPSVETAVEAIKRGAVDYLSKPFDLNHLEEIIRETLGTAPAGITPESRPEIKEVTMLINGDEVKARPEMTILEAAQENGVDIPTLCHYKHLAPYGGCRLCTVEITRGQRSRLVTSCVHPVEEGLKVQTESEEVIKVRRTLLEMMWSRAPGVQAIREYGIRYGFDKDRFDVEPTFCILCGLCVRYCREVKKKNIIGFIGRGTEREVIFQPDADFNECLACGECYQLCPTGVMPSIYGLAHLPR